MVRSKDEMPEEAEVDLEADDDELILSIRKEMVESGIPLNPGLYYPDDDGDASDLLLYEEELEISDESLDEE
jgi:hypothetical protein